MAESLPTVPRPARQTFNPFRLGWWKDVAGRLVRTFSLWLTEPNKGITHTVKNLEAVYWDGSASRTHPVLEIGLDGAVIDASVDWCENTLLRMSIRSSPDHVDSAVRGKATSNFWCQIVGRAGGHLSVEFVFRNDSERDGFRKFLSDVGAMHPQNR
jgi:hypothetical protein